MLTTIVFFALKLFALLAAFGAFAVVVSAGVGSVIGASMAVFVTGNIFVKLVKLVLLVALLIYVVAPLCSLFLVPALAWLFSNLAVWTFWS